MKYFVSIGADDDNLDTDTGVKANFQYVWQSSARVRVTR